MFPLYKYQTAMSNEDRNVGSCQTKSNATLCREDGNSILSFVTVVVATAAFRCNFDVPDVRFVLPVGLIYSFLAFVQKCGRARRDRRVSQSIIITTRQTAGPEALRTFIATDCKESDWGFLALHALVPDCSCSMVI